MDIDIYDELWLGGPKFLSDKNVFKIGSDSVLLSHFVNLNRISTVCDIGCGAGVLPVLLLHRKPSLDIDAIEISDAAVTLSQRNFKLNNSSVKLVHGDIRRHRELLEAGKYDLVISNPPYFPQKSGKTSENENIAKARDDRDCTLEDVVSAAAYLARWGGRFALVFRPERLSELFCVMTKYGIEPKRLRMVQNKAESEPSLVLIEGRRGGKPGLAVERPLILTNQNGGESDEIRKIYRR